MARKGVKAAPQRWPWRSANDGEGSKPLVHMKMNVHSSTAKLLSSVSTQVTGATNATMALMAEMPNAMSAAPRGKARWMTTKQLRKRKTKSSWSQGRCLA